MAEADDTPDTEAAEEVATQTSTEASLDAGAQDAGAEAGPDADPDMGPDAELELKPFDPDLLALMIGELGSPAIVEDKCHQIQLYLAQALMVLFKDKNDLTIEAKAGHIVQGTRTALLQAIEGEYCYCQTSIQTWSDDIAIYCYNDLIISIVECLMGGDDPENLDVSSRALSDLELDLAAVFFEIVNEALKATITRSPTIEHSVEKPSRIVPDTEDEAYKEYHAVAFSLDIVFGKLETNVTILVPQSKIIRTDIDGFNSRRRKSDKGSEWSESLSKQVYNSEIVLQANIGLEKLSIGDVGRLQKGDVLRFGTEGEPTIVLQANGRELFNCALGKSGNKYMVKVEEPFGDEDWKSDF